MRTLDDIVIKVDQLNDFMYFVEGAMLEATADEEMEDSAKRLHNLVYILMDQLHSLGGDLDEVNGHIKVCNALYAAGNLRGKEAEIEELKNEIEELKSKETGS